MGNRSSKSPPGQPKTDGPVSIHLNEQALAKVPLNHSVFHERLSKVPQGVRNLPYCEVVSDPFQTIVQRLINSPKTSKKLFL
jgi:hypothetical protein